MKKLALNQLEVMEGGRIKGPRFPIEIACTHVWLGPGKMNCLTIGLPIVGWPF